MSPITNKLFAFLRQLKNNNNREWFAENKSRYESDVLNPAIELVRTLEKPLQKISRYLIAEPKRSGGSIMRIYRDTRFAKDKTPYKTNLGIHFHHAIGGDIHAPGYYIHLQPGECFLAGGIWMPAAEPLGLVRQSIIDDYKTWKRITSEKKFATRFRFDGESLKTSPRNFDPNHPAIEDLRRKSFAAGTRVTEKDLMRDDVVEFIVQAFREAKPFMKFLCDALQQPF